MLGKKRESVHRRVAKGEARIADKKLSRDRQNSVVKPTKKTNQANDVEEEVAAKACDWAREKKANGAEERLIKVHEIRQKDSKARDRPTQKLLPRNRLTKAAQNSMRGDQLTARQEGGEAEKRGAPLHARGEYLPAFSEGLH